MKPAAERRVRSAAAKVMAAEARAAMERERDLLDRADRASLLGALIRIGEVRP